MRFIRVVSLLMFLVLFPGFAVPILADNVTLYEDDFNDGDAEGWEEIGTPWFIENNQYGATINQNYTMTQSLAGDYSWTDYSFEATVTQVEGTDKNLLFRATAERTILDDGGGHLYDLPVGYGLHITTSQVFVDKYRSGYGNFITLGSTFLDTPVGVPRKFRIDAMGNTFRVFVDDFSVPILEVTDDESTTPPVLTGRIGVLVAAGAIAPSKVLFDNIVVTDLSEPVPTTTLSPIPTPSLTPTPLPTSTPSPTPIPSPTPTLVPSLFLDVPYFSQNDPQWAGEDYDHIPYDIDKKGCAMTAAAMVLRYHGIDLIEDPVGGGLVNLDPSSLNAWLIYQEDGYVKEGLTNWEAITRWTETLHRMGEAEEGLPESPILDFELRNTSDEDLLRSDLIAGNPDILKLNYGSGTHFVVARGEDSQNWLINDPEDLTERLDETYGSQFYGLRRFYPTATNLSALLLFSEPGVRFLLIDSQGRKTGYDPALGKIVEEIPNSSYEKEEPYVNVETGEAPGEGVNLLFANDPESGSYLLEVTTEEKSYEVTVWGYNREAKVDQEAVTGNTASGKTQVIDYSQESGEVKIRKSPTFAKTREEIKKGVENKLLPRRLGKLLLAQLRLAETMHRRNRNWRAQLALQAMMGELRWFQRRIDPDFYRSLMFDLKYLAKHLEGI